MVMLKVHRLGASYDDVPHLTEQHPLVTAFAVAVDQCAANGHDAEALPIQPSMWAAWKRGTSQKDGFHPGTLFWFIPSPVDIKPVAH